MALESAAWARQLAAFSWSDARVAFAVFFAALFAYLSNATLLAPEPDTVPNAYLSASVLGDGDLAFSPFEAPFMFLWTAKSSSGDDVRLHVMQWEQVPPGSTKSYGQHYQEGRLHFRGSMYYLVPTARERPGTGEPLYVGTFGPAAGLMVLPFAALAQLVGLRLWQDPAAVLLMAKLTAALLIAGSVAMIYLTAAGFVSRRRALLVAAAYGLGTAVWTISSQSLWQQTPEIFFLSLGIFCLLRLPISWISAACAGFAFSAAAACRPTAILVAAVAAIWLLLADRRAFGAFVLAAFPLTAAMLVYNAYYFGSIFDFGQIAAGARVAQFKTGASEVWQTPFWLGAAGLLASPSRGLLIYSPFLAVAFLGGWFAWKDERYKRMRFLTLAVPALWTPAFLWFDWWGGWTYGYRPIVDSVPLLAVLCVPALGWFLERPVWRAVFALSLAWSIFVQTLGVFAYSPWGWNMKVIDLQGNRANVDLPAYRHRLWSFRDWQIGYLIVNFPQARADRGQQIAY